MNDQQYFLTASLSCQLKAGQRELSAFRSGEAYEKLRAEYESIIRDLNVTIKKLQKERDDFSFSRKEITRQWLDVLEDVQKEHEKEMGKLKKVIVELLDIIASLKNRNAELDEKRKKVLGDYYETAVKLEDTLEEVVEWLKREHGAVEVSRQSHSYLEQKQSLKASLIMRHRPDLVGELVNLEPPDGEDVEALKAFCEKIHERNRVAEEIADDIFPIDFHIYEIKCAENDRMRIGVETVWQVLDGSFSGEKKTMRQLRKLYKKIYLYYGVTAEDIKNETERYKSLLGVLCS